MFSLRTIWKTGFGKETRNDSIQLEACKKGNTFERKKIGFNEGAENELEESEDADVGIDIVVIGNKFVGKSSFIFRCVGRLFSTPYFPTTNIDFVKTTMRRDENQTVGVQIWDTPGDLRVGEKIAKELFSLASGFVILYDITDIQSYNDIFHWMVLVDQYALDNGKVIIVGNKADLSSDRKITKHDGMKAASCYGAKFMEVAVRHDRNVKKTFEKMVTFFCDNEGTHISSRRINEN